MNICTFLGRLTADPELRTTSSGINVTRFTVAVDRPYKKGEDKQADFINVVAWRGTAEFVTKYYRKGSSIGLSGSLRVEKYEKDGQKLTSYVIVADKVFFVGNKAENKTETTEEVTIPDDDDLPF